MPELPEVETVRRDLEAISGTTIRSVTVHDEKLVGGDSNLANTVTDWTIRKLDRRGKYLLFRCSEGFLLFSLRMTGNLTFEEPTGEPDRRIDFELDDRLVYFTSVRRFSRTYCYETTNPETVDKINKLGVDPLNGSLTPTYLRDAFANRTAAVKSLLMNQELIAGIGNIYANEICFEAGVRPDRSVEQLKDDECGALVDHTPEVLRSAIQSRGSSISDYARPEGDEGGFQDEFMVYGRRDETCYDCGTPIETLEVSGRSTFYCPTCQQ